MTADSLKSILERTRQNLLDLSLRNRLINTPRGAARSRRLEVVDERSDEVFRLLVREAKAMSFLHGRDDENADVAAKTETPLRLDQPADDANGAAARHRDQQLQTNLTSTALQERLLGLYYDARTFEEEQGVSILYLALGFLEWYESDQSDKPRYAPLILVPVELSRASASSRFKLRFRDDDLESNLSLQGKLRQEFDVAIPNIEEGDDFRPGAYFAKVEAAVQGQSRWKVHHNDIVLWFFSFAKYLMYRDLDPVTWPEHAPLARHPLLDRLLESGFEGVSPVCHDDDPLDAVIPLEQMVHVTDADSSQAMVIEHVRRGDSLVVQGPPGTGKSQTITNIIATAVQAGKKVLFVAEKLAALEVVKGRLDHLGLGPICLELHSHKANKKATLEELHRTLELGRPNRPERNGQLTELLAVRDQLNRHVQLMNSPLPNIGQTPFEIIGQLIEDGSSSQAVPVLSLSNCLNWSRAEFEKRCQQLSELANFTAELGPVADHPWRGSRRTTPLLSSDIQALLRDVQGRSQTLSDAEQKASELSSTLALPPLATVSLKSLSQLTAIARICARRPEMDLTAITDSVWEVHPEQVKSLIDAGRRLTEARQLLKGVASEVVYSTDLTETRQSLETSGRCWFWFLRRDYWIALGRLRGVLLAPMPRTLKQQLLILDAAITARTAVLEIHARNAIGQQAFGALWHGETSDFAALGAIVAWEQSGRESRLPWPFRQAAAQLRDSELAEVQSEALEELIKRAKQQWQPIDECLRLDPRQAFCVDDVDAVPLSEQRSRASDWATNLERLSTWTGYQIRRQAIHDAGLQPLIAAYEQGTLPSAAIVKAFRRTYFETLLKSVLDKYPELAGFHGASHQQRIERFRELDLARMKVARSEVALTHYQAIPRDSGLGEMAVVRGEIAKKRMHRPVRRLLRDAGKAVQAIKPVFMMSPISVAQFLEPGVLEFDLLVMDEASQVTPEDALGAIARTKQMVIVGDSRQLPPSRFFSKLLDEEQSEDEPDLNPTHLDSILGLCTAKGMSQRMLRWHYRSRHHSLIAVSNREFYDGRLCVVPSPTRAGSGLGLQFRRVTDGQFDRGGSATNRREAAIIADAVIEQARTRPQQSLGVAAFSVAQRDAIRDEVELRRRQNGELESFFATGRHDSFFIKNLENVQGDERDVIFISVGYAPDPYGNLTMNFGPLGTEGGERRLNVLISRAKQSCVVFSSITADQIDLGRAKSRGAAALKTFLQYAATGEMPTGDQSVAEPTEFEQRLLGRLSAAGLSVHPRVGTTGLSLDLAIVDPLKADCYVMGVECDGPTYQASRWARDRDRLRDTVLTDRGWSLHRIWSLDWLHRPDEQLDKLLEATDIARERILEQEQQLAETTAVAAPATPDAIARDDSSAGNELAADPGISYVEADIEVPSQTPILDLADATLADIVVQVVTIEGPVHRSEVARRILTLWNSQRMTATVLRKLDSAIDASVRSSRIEQDAGLFLAIAGAPVATVRSRAHVTSAGLRKPELLPPAEVRLAVHQLCRQHVGITRDQLASAVTKPLGFKVVSPRLRVVIEEQLSAMLSAGTLLERDGKLYVSESSVQPSPSNE